MNIRTTIVALAAVAALAPGAASAQAGLEGVWKITRIVATGANAATTANPEPSQMILYKGHYSLLQALPRTAAPAVADENKRTPAEKAAKFDEWSAFVANAGTYEVRGKTLIRTPSVAKNVSVMTGTQGRSEVGFELTGDTLVTIGKSAPGQPAREVRTTFTRVK